MIEIDGQTITVDAEGDLVQIVIDCDLTQTSIVLSVAEARLLVAELIDAIEAQQGETP